LGQPVSYPTWLRRVRAQGQEQASRRARVPLFLVLARVQVSRRKR